MNAMGTAEITALRTTAAETMLDTCQLGTVMVSTSGAYATETVSWATAIACGFRAAGAREALGSQAPLNDAVVRVPITTIVTSVSRIKLITKLGYTLPAPEVYSVQGGPLYGPTCITLRLQALPSGGVG